MAGSRNLLASVALACVSTLAQADSSQPVVVELYTSQGCSSCPPADAMLIELAKRDDVLALALHVDYWDYLGWTDEFADPAYTERQRSYARAAGSATIYTPQLVVEGTDHVVGHNPVQIMELIQKHRERTDPIELTLTREGGRLRIGAKARGEVPSGMVVQLVRFMPHKTIEIEQGENAGHTIEYVNIVSEWSLLQEWDGREPLSLDRDVSGAVAVIVQAPGHGSVLGAAQLD